MPRRVLKYDLPERTGADAPPILLPAGATIVSVGYQEPGTRLFFWAEVQVQVYEGRVPVEANDGESFEHRRLGVFLTGEEIPDDWAHVGTIHIDKRPHHAEVLHIYEMEK
jgi:hypothetical protein